MRIMYDAVNASNIPRSAIMVAGYVDQITIPPWTSADWNLFPNADRVHIVKKATSNFGEVLDVEEGDARPDEAPGWVQRRRNSGADPTVYCNYATWGAVRTAFLAAKIVEPHYWIAKYDVVADIPPSWIDAGCVAKQYRNTLGYDVSVVVDYWPGVDVHPLTPAGFSEDTVMIAPAATDDYIDVPCNGNRSLFISSSYNRHVNVLDIVCVGDTPGAVGADYVAEQLRTLDVAPDRPGGIGLPPGVRVVKIRYKADHAFTTWTA